jgi:hypothetical protein
VPAPPEPAAPPLLDGLLLERVPAPPEPAAPPLLDGLLLELWLALSLATFPPVPSLLVAPPTLVTLPWG